MLLTISSNLLLEDLKGEELICFRRSIENILKSSWESKHIVHVDYCIIEKLKSIVTNQDCLRVLCYIESNYSLLNYESIHFYVNIINGNQLLNKRTVNEKKIIDISLDFFQTTDLLQQTRILCEDLSDAYFFEEIAKYYQRSASIGNISFKYEPIHGGGNNIDISYKKHVEDKTKFCLTFCDNDMKYPSSEIGATLKKLRCVDSQNNLLCECIELDAHEIENLVPFNYLDDIQENTLEQKGIKFIKNIFLSDEKNNLKFYDIKKGIIKKHIINNQEYFEFAKKLIPYCENPVDLVLFDTFNENYQIIPPTGKIIKSFMKKKDILNIIQPDFIEFQQNEWMKIGSVFTFWTCARNNEALNI